MPKTHENISVAEHDRLVRRTYLTNSPHNGVRGATTTRLYHVALPRWARVIQQMAEAVAAWTKRFEREQRIG